MEGRSLSFEQATEIATRYQHLIGKPYLCNHLSNQPLTVTDVAAGPYDQDTDPDFLARYDEKHLNKSYKYISPDNRYRVWVLHHFEKTSWIGEDIREQLICMGEALDF